MTTGQTKLYEIEWSYMHQLKIVEVFHFQLSLPLLCSRIQKRSDVWLKSRVMTAQNVLRDTFAWSLYSRWENPADASATKCLGLSKCKVCWKTDSHESVLHPTTAKTCPSSPKIWPLGMTENWIKAIKAHAQARPYKSNFDWSLIASRIDFNLSLSQVYD